MSGNALTKGTTIAVIGLGAMGYPMAACLAKAGMKLRVFDTNAEACRRFAAEHGGHAASSARDAVSGAAAVITMLPTSAVVEQVLFGPEGAVGAFGPGTLVIEMTSGQPHATRRFAQRLEEQGFAMIDAPVSGGVPRAQTGELTIMVGGKADDVARATPVLEAMGKPSHLGPLGAGHAMKALNNLVSAGGFLIAAEALLIGAKFGIDPEQIVDTLNSSTGMNNTTLKKLKPYVLSKTFNSGFSMELMAKDISIALDLAEQQDLDTPFAALCRDIWMRASRELGRGADHTAIALFADRTAGSGLLEDKP